MLWPKLDHTLIIIEILQPTFSLDHNQVFFLNSSVRFISKKHQRSRANSDKNNHTGHWQLKFMIISPFACYLLLIINK